MADDVRPEVQAVELVATAIREKLPPFAHDCATNLFGGQVGNLAPSVGVEEVAQAVVEALKGAGLIADRDDALALLDLATRQLARFTQPGHPGTPCKRTGWIEVGTLDEEHEALRQIGERLR